MGRIGPLLVIMHVTALQAGATVTQALGNQGADSTAAMYSPFRTPRLQSGTDADGPLAPVLPTVWWNDLSTVTLGLWARLNFRGTQDRVTIALQRGFGGIEDATLGESVDFYAGIENPSFVPLPDFTESIAGWAREGTAGARIRVERALKPSSAGGGVRGVGGEVTWVATRQVRYLDRALWDNAGSIEATAFARVSFRRGALQADLGITLGGGVVYRRGDAVPTGGYESTPFGRGFGDIVLRTTAAGFNLGARGYAGLFVGDDLPRQRAIPVNGADPYQTLANPLVRTVGAPLVGREVFYHSPGHANLRAFRPGLAGRWALAANFEVERPVLTFSGVLRTVSLVAFFDAGLVDTVAVHSFAGRGYQAISDGGGGIRLQFHVLDMSFPVRVEFPLYVSDPIWAHHREHGLDYWEFRWLVSLQPIF